MTQLVADPANLSLVYAGVREAPSTAYLLVSRDGGGTWRRVVNGGTGPVLAPGRPSTVYLPIQTGLLRSTNAGRSWQVAGAFGLKKGMQSLVVDAEDPLVLYALRSGRVLRSTDGGATWKPVNHFGLVARDRSDIYQVKAHPVEGGHVYAFSRQGGVFEIQLRD